MKQLTISSLRDKLTQMQQEFGDLPIILKDADTSWEFYLTKEHLYIGKSELFIGVSYSDDHRKDTTW